MIESWWMNNKANFFGRRIYANGSVYKGEFKDYWGNGFGEFIFPDGTFYKGEFKDGLKHGQGKETFRVDGRGINQLNPQFDTYIGSFANDK